VERDSFFPHQQHHQLTKTFKLGTIAIIPPSELLATLEQHYTQQVHAFRGDVLRFAQSLQILQQLEAKLNQ